MQEKKVVAINRVEKFVYINKKKIKEKKND